MADRALFLDTPSMYFRSFFGIPESVTAPDGRPANAIRGLLDSLAWLITERRPTRVVAALDADWRPAFRVAALPSYKAHRVAPEGEGNAETVPDTLAPQAAAIPDFLDALGIACFGVAGYEADDVLGTLAACADCPAEVVTGDRDLFQVVDDARAVRVLYIGRGVTKYELLDEAVVQSRYGIPGRAYADFALLRGDPSDGLPGVPGIGEKTAATLISRFGSLESLLEAAEGDNPAVATAVRAKLRAAADYLGAAPVVVRVVDDVALPAYDDRLPASPRDPHRLVQLVDEWGVASAAERMLRALQATQGTT